MFVILTSCVFLDPLLQPRAGTTVEAGFRIIMINTISCGQVCAAECPVDCPLSAEEFHELVAAVRGWPEAY